MEKKEKRVLKVELGDDDKVVMMQELNEEDLDEATGGGSIGKTEYNYFNTTCRSYDKGGECSSFRITSPQDV